MHYMLVNLYEIVVNLPENLHPFLKFGAIYIYDQTFDFANNIYARLFGIIFARFLSYGRYVVL